MEGAASIIDMPWSDDKTIKLLYSIVVEHYEGVVGNIPHLFDILQQVMDERDHECDNMLKLLYSCASQKVLTQTIKSTKSRNQTLKRKYSDINPTTSASSSNRDSSPKILSDATTRFIEGMEFVDNFKKSKDSTGQKANDHCYLNNRRLLPEQFINCRPLQLD